MPVYSFHIQTFGCQMNANDSEWLRRSLLARGFVETSFENATLYILTTCSVRDKPEQKVYSELGRIASYTKAKGKLGVTVCVGGCVAQQVGKKLAKRFPQVRLIFGTDGVAQAPQAIERLMENPSLKINFLDFADTYEERDDPWLYSTKSEKIESVPPSVYVTIMQGCDNFCTYCIVPYVRGRQKSRDSQSILEECRRLIAFGAKEITLLGQNVNSFGLDNGKKLPETNSPFAELLHRTAALPGLKRLRFMTPHPKDFAPDVIDAFGTLKMLCSRVHLPLQSGSDSILARMGRRYTVERYLAIVERLKAVRPDILLSTDIIVGFPGETEKDFQESLDVLRQVGFVGSFSFIYSDRPGAKAVLYPDKVERNLALERLARLQEQQNKTTEEILALQVGKTTTILLENKSQRTYFLNEGSDKQDSSMREDVEMWQGKTDQGLVVNVPLPVNTHEVDHSSGWEGKLLSVFIEGAGRHSLQGKQGDVPW